MSKNFAELMKFVRLTHKIRNVERAVLLESYNRAENDAEHGYQLALVALYLIDGHRLKLDKYRCMGMAMAHDIVEAYVGDVSVFESPEARKTQRAREKKAIKQMQKDWPNFPSLHELIKEYEEHTTPEGKFVYALDKLMPAVNNYMYGGKAWKKQGVDLKWVKKIKQGKVEMSPTVDQYYQELLKLMEKNPEVFK